MPPVLTNSITIALTEDHYRYIAAEADARKVTLAEVARPLLLRGFASDPIETILLSEVLALRSLVLNLSVRIANHERLTHDVMQEEITAADSAKTGKARALLQGEGR